MGQVCRRVDFRRRFQYELVDLHRCQIISFLQVRDTLNVAKNVKKITPISPPPPAGCELYAFCGALFGICSMITLTVIAVDRYFVITRPLTSIGVLSRKRALLILVAAWTYSLGWSLPPFFGWSEDTHTHTHTHTEETSCVHIF